MRCDEPVHMVYSLGIKAIAMGVFVMNFKLTRENMTNSVAGKAFRSLASFGKRIEFWIIGEMLKEGLDVYVPLVDDMGIDAVIRQADGKFIEVQIKARSKDIKLENAALFAAIRLDEHRQNYWFVFYSEIMDTKWIMTSEEFTREASLNKKGKNKGAYTIWFNGKKKDKSTGEYEVHIKPQYAKYVAADFTRLKV